MPTRLLLIDDDRELTLLLTEFFEQEGFEMDTHDGGREAVVRACSGDYGLVILDVMLPEMSGFDLLRHIRRSCSVPVVLLTARGDDIDRIVGLEIGADDYVAKPFNPRELVARVRAVLRRLDGRVRSTDRVPIRVADVTMDPAARTVVVGGTAVDLTAVEFEILRALLEAAGQTVARDVIAEVVLGRQLEAFDRSVDMHISKIRRKLGPRPGGEERIKTIRSVGYIYTLPAAED